jgi:hypothetical protein
LIGSFIGVPERYINHLDPKLNKGVWTQAEDVKLKELFEEHGPQVGTELCAV